MGEKIRDLHPIKIGKSELMIELNEGYTKKQGRLIHIQNKHFRYAITENEFLKFASSVLRAKCEMDYQKNEKRPKPYQEKSSDKKEMDAKTEVVLNKFVVSLEMAQIDYRYIDGTERYACILVNEKDYKKFNKFVEENRIKRENHLYGEKFGYKFLYQMHSFQVLVIDDVYFDIYFQLPCYSLTPKTWIPLDKQIQSYVWEHVDKEDDMKKLDELSFSIYRISWSVFKRGGFSIKDKKVLNSKKAIFEDPEFEKCLRTVFFGFTDDIIDYLKKGQYDEIIPAYYSFDNY